MEFNMLAGEAHKGSACLLEHIFNLQQKHNLMSTRVWEQSLTSAVRLHNVIDFQALRY